MENKLPESFIENLEFIAKGLHGRAITDDFAAEWKVGADSAMLLLEYMVKTALIEVVWVAEQQEFCYAKTETKDVDAFGIDYKL